MPFDTSQIIEMQKFLRIKDRPITIYRREEHDVTCGYDEWLQKYANNLKERCCNELLARSQESLKESYFLAHFGFSGKD